MTTTTSHPSFAAIAIACARLYELPGLDFAAGAQVLSDEVRSQCCEAAEALADMATEVEAIGTTALEEAFVRTFELQPSCSPYAGPHLFGEEGFQRGRMLSGLREGFDRHGFEIGGELPDHVSVLLRFAAQLEPDERTELVAWCLSRPLVAMEKQLAATSNPYRHLTRAARLLFAPDGVPSHVTDVLSKAVPAASSDSCSGTFTENEDS